MLDGEHRIIKSAVRGEASAFGLLYDHYQPKIYRFVLIKVGQREDAEDLTHQVFINAWQNVYNYRSLGFPFSSWLYQIARNLVIDHYRTRKADLPIHAIDPDSFATVASAHFSVEHAMDMERVTRAIQRLKAEYQDVILMRFVEELSLKETARALEKSEGAVKLLQHRAVKELKTLLA